MTVQDHQPLNEPTPSVPGVGLIIIGDEILSGKRQDKHFSTVLQKLNDRGIGLDWVQYLGDDRLRLSHCLRDSFQRGDWVISCGGIGATPDDHTRQAAASALGCELVLHPEAKRLITERCADMAAEGRGSADMSLPENQQRLKMGDFPIGASIIPNPYNKIPGFSIRNHFFVPGFPVMAWPMVDWVLDQRWGALHDRVQHEERSFIVYELPESLATPVMESVERGFPGVKVFSLPSMGSEGERRHIELGIKAHASQIDRAFQALKQGIEALPGFDALQGLHGLQGPHGLQGVNAPPVVEPRR